MKSLYFLVFLLSINFIADVDAGWKFWKKKKDDNSSSTETPVISNPELPVTPSTTAKSPTIKGSTTKAPLNTNKALAAGADPGLVVGVGNTGANIKDNARLNKPSPGTEVALDLPSKPKAGNTGYRDWAIDLTGAGEGKQPPKVPIQGPGAPLGGQQPRPSSPAPGSSPGQLPSSGLPSSTGNRSPQGQQTPSAGPASLGYPSQAPKAGTPTSTGNRNPQGQQTPSAGSPSLGYPSQPQKPGTPTSTGNRSPQGQQTPSAGPASLGYPSQPQKPGTPISTGNAQSFPSLPSPSIGSGSIGTPSSSGNQSPSGGKTFAQVASGGTNPGSPASTPKQGVLSVNGQGGRVGGQASSGGTQPGRTPPSSSQPGKNGVSTGTLAAGAAGTGAIAAGAVAAGSKFSSNPTFSKGNTVTDEDLEKLTEALFIKDVNNAMKYISLNLQKQTTGSSPVDEAPQPLLSVKPEALQIPTIQKVLSIYDNYQLDTRDNEYISPAQRQEESLLIDTFLSTNVMSYAMRFLADKGLVRKDYYEYKDLLRKIWFNLFSRGDGKIGSSGFEHVFMTELKLGTEVSGLHNWIYFNAEEVKKRADYLGYVKKVDLGDKAAILKVHTKFNGIDKPVTTMFVGTSPELEMGLYTVCFLARPDQPCPVSLGGTKFNIVSHKFRYRGKNLIGSAYPEI